MKDRAYLECFGADLPPTGGSRDVGFLGCGMDALVPEVDHAIARLSDSARLSKLPSVQQRGASTSWMTEGSVEGLN